MIKTLCLEKRRFRDDKVNSIHFHNKWEIDFIFTDGIDILINDKIYTSRCGDVFIIPAYSFHRTNLSKIQYERFLIYYDEFEIKENANVLMPALRFLKNSDTNLIHLNEKNSETIKTMLTNAYFTRSKHGLFTDFDIICSFGNILSFIIEKVDIDKHLAAAEKPSNKNILSQISTYVSQNIDSNLSIPEICKEFGISKSTLWNIMKSSTGISMKEFIINLRISRATSLLSSDFSVTEISNLCGFSSYAHFIRTFTNKIGMPPNKYRKIMLSKQET